jgi:hypothetical protein
MVNEAVQATEYKHVSFEIIIVVTIKIIISGMRHHYHGSYQVKDADNRFLQNIGNMNQTPWHHILEVQSPFLCLKEHSSKL